MMRIADRWRTIPEFEVGEIYVHENKPHDYALILTVLVRVVDNGTPCESDYDCLILDERGNLRRAELCAEMRRKVGE